MRYRLILLLLVITMLFACGKELVYEGELQSSRFVARSFNTYDVMELTFIDGTVVAVSNTSKVFTPGEYYYIYENKVGRLFASSKPQSK